MPPILPKACAPRGDVSLHGGDDIRTQVRYRVEHPLVGHPVDRGTEVGKVDLPPLIACGQMHDDQASLSQNGAPVLGGAPLEGPIRLQALRHHGPQLQERGGVHGLHAHASPPIQ
jgi:hypothetical protein